jgi:chromosome segregation and condensation protein ScpB
VRAGVFFSAPRHSKCSPASPLSKPISQAEIDQLFDADKRGLVVKLRDLKLVEEFAGADGRLRFATTRTFLQRFGLASLQELTAASLSDKATAIEPLI